MQEPRPAPIVDTRRELVGLGKNLLRCPRSDRFLDDFSEFVFQNSLGTRAAKTRDQIPNRRTVHHGFNSEPVLVVEVIYSRRMQAWKQVDHFLDPVRRHVHAQRNFLVGQ